ncbi:FadR family transcriptional regulator [Saccharopolyspora erythraea]|uniref:FadR/GntR family transcriptional regulator n=1 Tax=Saccharopolyspora erythraea TaxID=1836 RepID=UPI001BEFFF44|nr:FCD domain-containing protein [Saccharopolyspora erythraea]QUH01724.1 FadR family transcriptional regulator [Saccharopolyspora erythraea]
MVETRRLRRGPVVPEVERALRELLAEGRWAAGEKLPSEVQLAADLGVGRSSVREAVRLLARDGLLDVRHGSGTFVAAAQEETGDLRRMLRRARLLEVYEVRRALEVESARLAAQRVRPEDVEGIAERLSRRQARLDGDPAAFVDADLDFHRVVVELSGNAVLLGLFDSVRPALAEALTAMVAHETGIPDVSCAHADLLEALRRGDSEAAVAATVENLESVMATVRAKVAAK